MTLAKNEQISKQTHSPCFCVNHLLLFHQAGESPDLRTPDCTFIHLPFSGVCVCVSSHSPPQPSLRCWPASPEGLVPTATAPTQKCRWTDLEAHSETTGTHRRGFTNVDFTFHSVLFYTSSAAYFGTGSSCVWLENYKKGFYYFCVHRNKTSRP